MSRPVARSWAPSAAPPSPWARLRPVHVGAIAAGAALAFVLLRLVLAADGDITRFVVAGDTFVDRSDAAVTGAHLHVFPGNGYDGQFYWRLAVDPLAWHADRHDGVALDGAYRAPRLGYPLLAHAAAGGRPGPVAWSLVGVNVGAVGATAWAAAAVARRRGTPAVWGLAVAAAPGLVMALGRDLAEPVTVAALVGGVVAVQQGRVALAALAWSFAVITREQALVVVAAYGICRVAGFALARRPGPTAAARPDGADDDGGDDAGPGPGAGGPGWTDAPWCVPVAVFVAWQAVLWVALGRLPAAAAGGTNLVPPLRALVPGLVGWVQGDLGRIHAVAPLQLAVAVALVVAAARAAPHVRPPDRYLVVALGLASLAATCLAASIWRDPSDLRHLVDVSVLSWLVLICARRTPPTWAAVATAVTWAATATARVVAI